MSPSKDGRPRPMERNVNSSARVRSVERAITAIEVLARSDGNLTLGDIARELRAPKSTTLNILRTLVDRRILEVDDATKTYKIGFGLSLLASGRRNTARLAAAAKKHLERLVETTEEVALLAVLQGDETTFIEMVEADQTIKYVARVGTRRPLFGTSGGKVSLAYQPTKFIDDYIARTELRPFTAKTITDPHLLKTELARIRRRGYAISDGEFIPSLIGLAAPVFYGPGGKFAAAIVVPGPAFRMRTKIKSVSASLCKCATALTHELQHAIAARD